MSGAGTGDLDNGTRSKANSFALDNEAVRFVYAYHNNVNFEKRDVDDFAMSWERTVSEIHRMLDYAASIEPHDVHQTVSVNQAREAVLLFAKPLADINDLIETNKRLLAERQKELEAMMPVIEELKGKIEFTHVVYEREELTYPITVCSRCASVEDVPNTNQKQVVYTQTCHDHCYLSG
ncbi:hypothetical protein AAVH_23093 [Aphelenchoides avenae]|nr:hypothetical protein AAVH_23093 [Aphelenchus avenae]